MWWFGLMGRGMERGTGRVHRGWCEGVIDGRELVGVVIVFSVWSKRSNQTGYRQGDHKSPEPP